MEKVIITAPIVGGIHTPTMSPYLPVTHRQIADQAVRAYEAGAAVAHIHARNSVGDFVGRCALLPDTSSLCVKWLQQWEGMSG